ncbi:hypothetical protein C8R45DRAFT_1115848 [Mycena sanguinolenta]|nr:hypothetical protein C8R45DRAFT_1115848 [Mycena sanguinolenta]
MALGATSVRKGTGRGWDGMWVVWVPSAHLHYGLRVRSTHVSHLCLSLSSPLFFLVAWGPALALFRTPSSGESKIIPRLRATSSATVTPTSPSASRAPPSPAPTPHVEATPHTLLTNRTHPTTTATTPGGGGVRSTNEAIYAAIRGVRMPLAEAVVVVQLREEGHEEERGAFLEGMGTARSLDSDHPTTTPRATVDVARAEPAAVTESAGFDGGDDDGSQPLHLPLLRARPRVRRSDHLRLRA